MLSKRLYHQGLARLAARWPALKDKLVASFNPLESTTIPWCPVDKPPERSKIALVTTAGIHHRSQRPFDMKDSEGDPSFRIIDPETIAGDYQITHDYYDHRDADRDLNVVFPIVRLKEMLTGHRVGAVSEMLFSFMGHIDGRHVRTLVHRTAPRVARMLKEMNGDQQAAVLREAFNALCTIESPGTIIDVGWRWRRETYPKIKGGDHE